MERKVSKKRTIGEALRRVLAFALSLALVIALAPLPHIQKAAAAPDPAGAIEEGIELEASDNSGDIEPLSIINVSDEGQLVNAIRDCKTQDIINLTKTFTCTKPLSIKGKNVTIQLGTQGNFNLFLSTTSTTAPALEVTQGSLSLSRNMGRFYVSSTNHYAVSVDRGIAEVSSAYATGYSQHGVHATGGATVIVEQEASGGTGVWADGGSKVTVQDALSPNGLWRGVYASGSGTVVTVKGRAGDTSNNCAEYGVQANDGANVNVSGNAVGSKYGVYATGANTKVTVGGNAHSYSTYGNNTGAAAYNGASISVSGNAASVATPSDTGAVASGSGSTITIGGNVVGGYMGAQALGGATITVDGKINPSGSTDRVLEAALLVEAYHSELVAEPSFKEVPCPVNVCAYGIRRKHGVSAESAGVVDIHTHHDIAAVHGVVVGGLAAK